MKKLPLNLETIRKAWAVYPKQSKRRVPLVMFLGILGTAVETFGIGLVIPVMTTMSKATPGNSGSVLQPLFNFFGIRAVGTMVGVAVLCIVTTYFVKNLIKSDSLQYRWENEWGQEFKDDSEKHFHISNSDDFINYIRRYSLTEKEKKVLIEGENQIEKINYKIKRAENKFVDYSMADQPPSIFLIIFLIIAFPLRFIFYALKWSIKTLRQ
jgi:ABC-type multidrug transport system fused ATPase/permease subunit